ncbi:MAG TPA: undecaprenyl-diphosphate phosphatase [Gemmatimonadales bacterium]|nr:undecaprenyl-diphosphate phosphatase [Gemmatimonadales bacterium]
MIAPLHPYAAAVVLGLVEGATEFLPISSTGHLIVVGQLIGFTGSRAKTFEIFIQLGAILAVLWHYRRLFVNVVIHAFDQTRAGRLLVNLAIAFIPAAVVGFFAHDWIKRVLFDPRVVAWALIIGGLIIVLIEWWKPRTTIQETDELPPDTALGVGLAQVLSLIPGTSRSGATIMGGYALGMSRLAATEFSFFLAIPTMLAATLYELFTSRATLGSADFGIFAVGFVVAFVSALVVIRVFLHYVARHSFLVFAWYRIAFGLLVLALLRTGSWML